MVALMKRLRKGKRGFTLIELIVVMAIIAILALIAVPRLTKFREQAISRREEANARIAFGAAAMVVAEHGAPEQYDGLSDIVWPDGWEAGTPLSIDGVPVTDAGGTQVIGYGWGAFLEKWPEAKMTIKIKADGDIEKPLFDGQGGGNGSTISITVAQARTATTFLTAPTAGNLLIVIAGSRSGEGGTYTTPTTATLAGYNLGRASAYRTGDGDRRIVAVFYRVANGTVADQPGSVSWGGTNITTEVTRVMALTGAASWTFQGSGSANNAAGGSEVDVVHGVGANQLAITAFAWRDGPPAGLQLTNLNANAAAFAGGGVSAVASYGYTTTGFAGVKATYTNSLMGVGAVVTFTVTAP